MMRVASRPGDRIRRQAMPVVNSILWKPLRDSHYVLTSVQPDQGGFRQIFVQQPLLDRIRGRSHGPPRRRLLGLLLGSRWDCPVTGTRYVVIQSFEETDEATHDSKTMTAALVDRLARHSREESIECVGWYGSSDGREPDISGAQAAVHASLFEEPWPTALILAEGGASGAFFLYDRRASRWFQAPFYEVSSADRKDQAAKMTSIAWPAYLTTETVVALPASGSEESPARARETASTPESASSRRSALSTIAQAIDSSGAAARRIGSALRSSITGRAEAKARKAAELAEKARIAEAERKEQARIAHAERLERARAAAAAEQAERDRLAAEQAERQRLAAEQAEQAEQERLAAERERTERDREKWERAERERAERERAERERLAAERTEQARLATQQIETARRSEPVAAAPTTTNEAAVKPAPQMAQPAPPARAAAVEPARPTTDRRRTPPRVADDGEDTTASDQPYRYLALARREGFQVSANVERTGAEGAETVWLLNESEFGLQITLVTSDLAVVEATLHYNIRIKDDAVLRATSPEHRDLDSRTIYVRESCVESLRARCRRLRATGALQRIWKVTPHFYPPETAAQ